MESYSHLWINQLIQEAISTLFFFLLAMFFLPIKRQVVRQYVWKGSLLTDFVATVRLWGVQSRSQKTDFQTNWILLFRVWLKAVKNKMVTSQGVTTSYRDSVWAALLTSCITQHVATQTPLVFLGLTWSHHAALGGCNYGMTTGGHNLCYRLFLHLLWLQSNWWHVWFPQKPFTLNRICFDWIHRRCIITDRIVKGFVINLDEHVKTVLKHDTPFDETAVGVWKYSY